MDLYVMQHGEARSKDDDPNRPLTDTGRATIERVARRAAGPGLCLHGTVSPPEVAGHGAEPNYAVLEPYRVVHERVAAGV